MLFGRTTISCVAALFLAALLGASEARGAITFPLQAIWSATLPDAPAFVPAFDSERVYVPLRNNQLAALLLTDGSVAWSVECPMTAPPTAGDGLVYVGSDGLIESRAQNDGRARWRRPVPGRVTLLHWDSGWLFAALDAGPVLAIRAADGQILWQRDFGSTLAEPAVPAAGGERLYLPLKDGRVSAVVLATGEDVWTHKLAEPASGILPVGDRVFVGGRDNQFHSLDAKDGDADWSWKTGADVLGLPVLDEERVYFIALDNVLRGHDRGSGSMEWKRVLPVRPFTGPILIGQMLIASGVAAELHAFDTRDGRPIEKFIAKGAEGEEMLLAAPPHLSAKESLILVTRGGQVRALGSASAAAPPPASSPAPPGTPPAPAAEPAPDAPQTAPAVP